MVWMPASMVVTSKIVGQPETEIWPTISVLPVNPAQSSK
jgi:hypothetical protein